MSTKIKECFALVLGRFSTILRIPKSQSNSSKRSIKRGKIDSYWICDKNVDFILIFGLKLGKKS